jgi:hypothetical protein
MQHGGAADQRSAGSGGARQASSSARGGHSGGGGGGASTRALNHSAHRGGSEAKPGGAHARAPLLDTKSKHGGGSGSAGVCNKMQWTVSECCTLCKVIG